MRGQMSTHEIGQSHSSADGAVSRRVGVLRYSAAHVLMSLVLSPVVTPFGADFPGGDPVAAGLRTRVLIAAVLAVGARRKILVWAVALVTPALIAKWLNHVRPDLVPPEVFLVTGLLFIAFVVLQLLHFILRAVQVN